MKSNLTVITPYFPTKQNHHAGIFVYDQVTELTKHYDKVSVLVAKPVVKISRKFPFVSLLTTGDEIIEHHNVNVTCRPFYYIPFPKDSIFYALSLRLSLKFWTRKTIGKIVVHTLYPLGVASLTSKLQTFIVTHGSDLRYFVNNPKQRQQIISTLNNSTTIAVSQGLYNEVVALSPSSKIYVINNGININSEIKTLVIDDKNKSFRFIFVGNLIKLKGVYELVEAFSKLQEEHPCIDVALTIVGDGVEFKGLSSLVESLGCRNIDFRGALDNPSVLSLMANHQALVLPSYQEGFGRVIIEMLSLGKPVISTKSGGPEYIINDDTGVIVSPGDAQELSNAMYQMYSERHKYDNATIKKYFTENFCLEKRTKDFVNILENKL